jgi:glycosyltransferase involved in cell wall biosynthesis
VDVYEQAIEINNKNADAHSLRGNALKRMGRIKQAINSYKTAFELDNSRLYARDEVINLGGQLLESSNLHQRDTLQQRSRTLFFDINDFFFYLTHHMHVSGIQRVVSNIAAEIINNDDGSIKENITFVITHPETLSTMEAAPFDIMKVVSLAKRPTTTREALDEAIQACYKNAKPARIKSGDVYVVTGAFWVSTYYSKIMVELREKGVAFGVYVYDLIPITHRNFVTEELWRGFTLRFNELLSLTDFVLTISDYVASEVRNYLETRLGLNIPVRAVPLAQELEDAGVHEAELGAAVLDAASQPYVLCVGTIEIRKNHQYLVNLWRELVASRGTLAPNLVLVGRWGWMIDSLKQQLESTDYLDGKIIVIDSVSDSELSHLYRSCLFTVFASFVEGWGLPVGESLAYGKPCIAAKTSSIPEVGGDFVRYFDPNDLASGRREVTRVLDDRNDLAEWAERIRTEFTPRTWAQVAKKFCTDISELAPQSLAGRPRAYFKMPPGKVVEIGDEARNLAIRENVRSAAATLVRISGWHQTEKWGCWAKLRNSTIRFIVDAPQGAQVGVALLLRKAQTSSNAVLTVRSGKLVTTVNMTAHEPKWRFARGEVGENGVVELNLQCAGDFPVPAAEKRSLFVGLQALGCYVEGDLAQRLDLLQNVIMN